MEQIALPASFLFRQKLPVYFCELSSASPLNQALDVREVVDTAFGTAA